ncbi:unnamed protein product [Rotaria sp. Silwood2]|nr:unnamed protein product [Rotaria sp. Silwood2]
MSVYRNLLKNELIVPPIIPMFPVCMKDLTFIHLGNPTRDDGLINCEKLRMMAKEIRYIMNMSSSSYDISNMFDSPTSHPQVFAGFGHQSTTDSVGTMRRNHTGVRSSVMANAKRIYDEALMIKRVKTYLNTAEIIEDENRLLALTNQCEPDLGGNLSLTTPILTLAELSLFTFDYDSITKEDNDEKPSTVNESEEDTMSTAFSRSTINSPPIKFRFLKNHFRQNATTLKRRPSPSTSSLSSNSSSDRRGTIQLTKFGTQSPDDVNKLLRLSNSSYQIKSRAPLKPNPSSNSSALRTALPFVVDSITTTGLTSVNESIQHRRPHVAKIRDANKLTSESSSLNFKHASSTLLVRLHTQSNQNNNNLPKQTDSRNDIAGDRNVQLTKNTFSDEYSSIKTRNQSISSKNK